MGYTSTQFLIFDASSTANFDAMGTAIHNAIAAMGWTQTTDTGQVVWGSNPAYPANGSTVYEIWQMADALQTGSTKVFLRLDYANIQGMTSGPLYLTFQIGTGTNGSGTLTGFTSRVFCINQNVGNQGAAVWACYFSGDTDRLGMTMWVGAINCCVTIERTKNTAGSNNTDGVVISVAGNIRNSGSAQAAATWIANSSGYSNSTCLQHTVMFIAPSPASLFIGNGLPVIDDGGGGSLNFNNTIAMTPIFPCYGKWGNPLTTMGFCKSGDVPGGVFFSTTLYGATRTFITNSIFSGKNTNLIFCMRYD